MTDQPTLPEELQTKSGYVPLTMPNAHPNDPEHRENELANLDFGPAGKHADDHDYTNITFQDDGTGTGRAFVRGDHPLIPDLLRKYPQVIIGDTGGTARVFVCSTCEREFGSKLALSNHTRSHRAKDEE